MRFSHSVTKELSQELLSLHERRREIDKLIEGIKAILSADPKGAISSQATESGGTRVTSKKNRAPAIASARANGSLRHKLTRMLTSTPGCRAADLVQELQRDGFVVGGVTPLSARVSHELARLRRLRILRKSRGGRYSIATRNASDPTAESNGAGA